MSEIRNLYQSVVYLNKIIDGTFRGFGKEDAEWHLKQIQNKFCLHPNNAIDVYVKPINDIIALYYFCHICEKSWAGIQLKQYFIS